jgi:hypothetical protein
VKPNLAGNLSDFPGPGDLPGCGDPRNSLPMLTEDEARAVFEKMRSGEVEEFLNLYLKEGGILREPADLKKFVEFVIRELIEISR